MSAKVKIALMGAGLIGKQHIKAIEISSHAQLSAIIDPSKEAIAVADKSDVPIYSNLAELLEVNSPDGIIIATPNRFHFNNGMDCIAAKIPMIMEKPICDNLEESQQLVEAAEIAEVPILVGHHRRHNPILINAKKVLDSGVLGQILAVHAMCWFYKPDSYFNIPWHRNEGAGPVLINAIHDIDNLRYLFGEIISVQAMETKLVRNHEVEETAIILLAFKSGMIATISVSDAIVSPWNWEMTSGENPDFPIEDSFCCLIGGTHGSLSIPNLEIKTNVKDRSWRQPIMSNKTPFKAAKPLPAQIDNFCNVIQGRAEPRVSGRDGLETLKVISAVKEASKSGQKILL